jgi:2-polyprenyl-3-methyl-5-hydroxy-6-metoxy-1,4-benzoquinol methylase
VSDVELWDDPERDYRTRYDLPTQFVWHVADWPRIDFDGYLAVVTSLLPAPPASVLDVGCGPGFGAKRLVDLGYDVHGVDYSERAIGFARLLVPEGHFVVGDVRRLAEVQELEPVYDLAICIEVLEHVPPEHRVAMLSGIRSRLRVGGFLVITTPTTAAHENRWDYRRVDEGELVQLLEQAALDVVHVAHQHRLHPLFSIRTWRVIQNRFYDLRVLRQLLRRVFLRYLNLPKPGQPSGRVVVKAQRSDA